MPTAEQEFDMEQTITGRIIRMLWSPRAFKVKGGDSMLLGYTEWYANAKHERNLVGTAITGNVVACFPEQTYPSEDGESFLSFEPDNEFTLGSHSLRRVQAALAGEFPDFLVELDLFEYRGRVEYYVRGQTRPWCSVFLQFFQYGERTAAADVNWSACGDQSPETAALFARVITQAARDAESMNTNFRHHIAHNPDMNQEALRPLLKSVVRKVLSNTSGSNIPLPPAE